MKGKKRPASRGAALALVLWAVFLLVTAMTVIMSVTDFDLDLEGLAARRFDARQLALSGFAYASHPSIPRGDALLAQQVAPGKSFEAVVVSEDARFNINRMLLGDNAFYLNRLFLHWGLDERAASKAVDCLKDWVDSDELRSLNGAEADDYSESEPFLPPANRPFLSVSEMARVRGMDVVASAKPDWAEYFSVRSSGKLDVQDVSADFLIIFADLSQEQVDSILAFRMGPDGYPGTLDDGKITSLEVLSTIVPLAPAQMEKLKAYFIVGSDLKRIISRGKCGGFQHEIVAVRSQNQNRILEWREQ